MGRPDRLFSRHGLVGVQDTRGRVLWKIKAEQAENVAKWSPKMVDVVLKRCRKPYSVRTRSQATRITANVSNNTPSRSNSASFVEPAGSVPLAGVPVFSVRTAGVVINQFLCRFTHEVDSHSQRALGAPVERPLAGVT